MTRETAEKIIKALDKYAHDHDFTGLPDSKHGINDMIQVVLDTAKEGK